MKTSVTEENESHFLTRRKREPRTPETNKGGSEGRTLGAGAGCALSSWVATPHRQVTSPGYFKGFLWRAGLSPQARSSETKCWGVNSKTFTSVRNAPFQCHLSSCYIRASCFCCKQDRLNFPFFGRSCLLSTHTQSELAVSGTKSCHIL